MTGKFLSVGLTIRILCCLISSAECSEEAFAVALSPGWQGRLTLAMMRYLRSARHIIGMEVAHPDPMMHHPGPGFRSSKAFVKAASGSRELRVLSSAQPTTLRGTRPAPLLGTTNSAQGRKYVRDPELIYHWSPSYGPRGLHAFRCALVCP